MNKFAKSYTITSVTNRTKTEKFQTDTYANALQIATSDLSEGKTVKIRANNKQLLAPLK